MTKTKIFLVVSALTVLFVLGCQSTARTDDMSSDMESDTMMDDNSMSSDMTSDMTSDMSSDAMDSSPDLAMSANDSMSDNTMSDTQFDVTIQVLSGSSTPIAPLAWAVHTGPNPFVEGEMGDRLHGLEKLAEDGDPTDAAHALADDMAVTSHGVVAVPAGAMDPAPAGPGTSYTFTVSAHDGEALSFATMYVQSNDLFFSPTRDGLALFSMMTPISADVTDQIVLYDAGTEVNEEPGMGPHQAPRQAMPNSGADEMGQGTPVEMSDHMYAYPAVDSVIRVTVKPHDMM